MKKGLMKYTYIILSIALFAICFSRSTTAQGDIDINQTFPDINMQNYIKSITGRTDDLLTVDDIENITTLSIPEDVKDITGIQTLINVKRLYINSNTNIESIDLSNMEKLETLMLTRDDQLSSINLTGCKNITWLTIQYTKVKTLSLKDQTQLVSLYLQANQFNSLDVSSCAKTLTVLDACYNSITTVKGLDDVLQHPIERVCLDAQTVTLDAIFDGDKAKIAQDIELDHFTYSDNITADNHQLLGIGDLTSFTMTAKDIETPFQPTYPLKLNVTINKSYTVYFIDNGNIISKQVIYPGENAVLPQQPIKDGYTFIGWDQGYTNIQSSINITSQYKALPTISSKSITTPYGKEINNLLSYINAHDADGKVLTPIMTSPAIDYNKAGDYIVEYYVEDQWGGKVTGQFTVTVEKEAVPVISEQPDKTPDETPDEIPNKEPTIVPKISQVLIKPEKQITPQSEEAPEENLKVSLSTRFVNPVKESDTTLTQENSSTNIKTQDNDTNHSTATNQYFSHFFNNNGECYIHYIMIIMSIIYIIFMAITQITKYRKIYHAINILYLVINYLLYMLGTCHYDLITLIISIVIIVIRILQLHLKNKKTHEKQSMCISTK